LIEADTDGVYFAVPVMWTEADERRVVAEVGALLPPLVQLELEGRYAAMLSHEPKNYALLGYDSTLLLRGVAFRSSRSEPFGNAFLRRAIACLLVGDIVGVRNVYLEIVAAIGRRLLSTRDVASRVRLTKSPDRYLVARETRRELPYEALLASGRTDWEVGERVHIYRKQNGEGGVVSSDDDAPYADPRDYDTVYYIRLLRSTYAQRLARAFAPEDFCIVFGDADQYSLFTRPIASIGTVLTMLPQHTNATVMKSAT